VCVLIKLFSSLHHLLFDIVYVSLFLFLLLLCSKGKRNYYIKKAKTPSAYILKKNQHTLPFFFSFISFHFLYSNPCFSLSLSSFFTIFTDNTLKRSFVFKKQTKKIFFFLRSYVSDRKKIRCETYFG
jgi:hypothetical protein